MRQSSLI